MLIHNDVYNKTFTLESVKNAGLNQAISTLTYINCVHAESRPYLETPHNDL